MFVLSFVFNFVGGGFDHVPVDSMQGLEIGSQQHGPPSNYGQMDIGHRPDDVSFDQAPPPQPPRDNNQMAAWYDTDL